MDIRDIIIASIGLVLGVLFEDPLTRFKNFCIHRYKRLFYKKPQRINTSEMFSFGPIKTSWITIDGDGEAEYSPPTIITHFDNHPLELPEDLAKQKKEIKKKEEVKRRNGEQFLWNGSRYFLDKFLIDRTDSSDEDLALRLWFRPTDFYTFLATNISLDDEALRTKYLSHVNWVTTAPRYFSNDFAIYLVVITADEYTILPKRSNSVGVYPNTYTISLTEGLSRTLDRGTTTFAPDMYRAAIRGVGEELGITDISASDITLLSFGVNTRYVQWSLLGMAKVNKTIEEILDFRNRGVKDKWESSEFNMIKFDLHEIVKFVSSHQPWAPGSLACLYHVLVHEFGREKTEKALTSMKI